MNIGDIFNLLLVQPLINLIILILKGLEGLHIPGAFGFSLIFSTILISLITWPFRSSQLRNMKKTTEVTNQLKGEIDALKEKHKGDKMVFNQAKAKLLQEHGINPAAGCLPSLIPILLIIPFYQIVFAFFEEAKGLDKINYFLYSPSWRLDHLPNLHFLGLNLATKPAEFTRVGTAVLAVPLITAALTLIQSLMMSPKMVGRYKSDSPKEVKKEEKEEDMTTAIQSQMMFMMPLMIGYAAFNFPIGLAIYWNINTIIGIIQQYGISGWGGVPDFVNKLWKKH
mgnify:CR=1 FL=1